MSHPTRCRIQDENSWEALSSMEICWLSQFFAASHVCSYTCFFSQFTPGSDAYDGCWLSEKPEGAPGSYCGL